MKKFLFVLSSLSLAATASFAVEKVTTTKTETHKETKHYKTHTPSTPQDEKYKSQLQDEVSTMTESATSTASEN